MALLFITGLMIRFLQTTAERFFERFGIVIQQGPETLQEIDFAWFEENGLCTLLFIAPDGTYARIGAGISPVRGVYSCNIGVGILEKWPGMSAILEEIDSIRTVMACAGRG